MSDSDDSMSIPADSRVEEVLRAIVAKVYKAGNTDELTVKRLRGAAETELALPGDFFKTNAQWKSRSQEIIKAEVDSLDAQDAEEPASGPPPKPAPRKKAAAEKPAKAKAAPKPKPKPKPVAKKDTKKGTPKKAAKRKSSEVKPEPQKRRKVAASDSDELSEVELEALQDGFYDVPEPELKPKPKPKAAAKKSAARDTPKKGTKRKSPEVKAKAPKRRKVSVPDSGGSDDGNEGAAEDATEKEASPAKARKANKPQEVVESDSEIANSKEALKPEVKSTPPVVGKDELENEEKKEAAKPVPVAKAEDSESELSSVIDEPPPPKRKRQRDSEKPTKGSKGAKGKTTKTKEAPDVSPDEAEMKRLQGWLIKCGIRKLWGKELKPFDTSKAKVNHLRDLLKEAGMDGRYSLEKARQIKERREMAADLEAVKEFGQRWGHDDEDGSGTEEKPKPRRRLARPADFAFLGDEDGEETD